jgi:hypothetical protein
VIDDENRCASIQPPFGYNPADAACAAGDDYYAIRGRQIHADSPVRRKEFETSGLRRF